jgi:hypothetical protein
MAKQLGEIFPFRENVFEPLPTPVSVLNEEQIEFQRAGMPLSGLTKKEFQALAKRIRNAGEYREQLLLLFNCSGNLIIQTMISLSEQEQIDLSPKEGTSQPGIYNALIKDMLLRANQESETYCLYKNRFTSFEHYAEKLNQRLERTLADRSSILLAESATLQKEFPDITEFQQKTVLDFDDMPDRMNYSIDRVEVYNFLKGGGVIDYDTKFIDTRHHIIILQCEEVLKYHRYLSEQISGQPLSKSKTDILQTNNVVLAVKPKIVSEHLETIKQLLFGYFNDSDQEELSTLLSSGEDALKPLVFNGNGNILADVFKQLIKTYNITGCNQIELEGWISRNFSYTWRGSIKPFTKKYLNGIISTNKDLCRRPIVDIKLNRDTGKYLISKT